MTCALKFAKIQTVSTATNLSVTWKIIRAHWTLKEGTKTVQQIQREARIRFKKELQVWF